MLANHGHPEIGAILAAIAFRNSEAQMARLVREVLRLAQQRLPLLARQATVLEIRARPFAAMIEEADVVVFFLERLDLLRDEAVQFVKIGDEVSRQCEVQGAPPVFLAVAENEVCKSTPASGLSRATGLRIE